MTVTILICSLAVAKPDCTPATASDVIRFTAAAGLGIGACKATAQQTLATMPEMLEAAYAKVLCRQ